MTTCGSHPRSDYIDSPERPSNVQTYQTVDKLSKHVKYVDNDVSSYGLSWMVRERVISRFFKKWPPKIMKSQVSGPPHRNEVTKPHESLPVEFWDILEWLQHHRHYPVK